MEPLECGVPSIGTLDALCTSMVKTRAASVVVVERWNSRVLVERPLCRMPHEAVRWRPESQHQRREISEELEHAG
jgi:hypothetical protein